MTWLLDKSGSPLAVTSYDFWIVVVQSGVTAKVVTIVHFRNIGISESGWFPGFHNNSFRKDHKDQRYVLAILAAISAKLGSFARIFNSGIDSPQANQMGKSRIGLRLPQPLAAGAALGKVAAFSRFANGSELTSGGIA